MWTGWRELLAKYMPVYMPPLLFFLAFYLYATAFIYALLPWAGYKRRNYLPAYISLKILIRLPDLAPLIGLSAFV